MGAEDVIRTSDEIRWEVGSGGGLHEAWDIMFDDACVLDFVLVIGWKVVWTEGRPASRSDWKGVNIGITWFRCRKREKTRG